MKTSDPALAKEFAKCVKIKDDWDKYNDTVMLSICKASANQDDAYRQAIIDTKNKTIVEAMNGDLEWASGMNWYATKHTRSDRFPGKNKLGNVLMEVRESITKAMLSPERKVEKESQPDLEEIQTVHYDDTQVITTDIDEADNANDEVSSPSATENNNANIDNTATPAEKEGKNTKPNSAGDDETKTKKGSKRTRSASGHTSSPP